MCVAIITYLQINAYRPSWGWEVIDVVAVCRFDFYMGFKQCVIAIDG